MNLQSLLSTYWTGKRKTRLWRLAVLAAILSLLALPQMATAEIVLRYDTALARQDLLLIGFSEITLHAMDVKGDVSSFEAGNDWLKEDFAANYRASLFANGNLGKLFINGSSVLDSRIDDEYRFADPSVFRLRMSVESTEPLWDTWRFTGEGLYDPHRLWEFGNLDTRLLTQPQEDAQLELLARLESDRYGYIEGGSLRPSFKNTAFSLHKRSLFGVFADLESGPVGAEAVAGKLEGKKFREGSVVGIRADGTSGPYNLANTPVTRGSEEVKIEVRDRFDETTVLSSRTLTRDLDYDVDYYRGRILLYEPVASETVASDPVYIVITYDYQREADDDLFGGRARVLPLENSQAGVSYLHRNRDNNAVGAGEEEPDDLMAADFAFDLQEFGKTYFEIAGADTTDGDKDNMALRAGWSGRFIDRLSTSIDFQRIEDGFRSFTNSDLNPNKNQQRIGLAGAFDLTDDQTASAGYRNLRGLEANGQFNPYAGRREEEIINLGYKNRLADYLKLGVGLERRDIEDRDDLSHENNRQQRAILDLGGERDQFGLLGEFGYGLHYEYITVRNYADSVGNNNTNQVALSLASRPVEAAKIELTQKLRVRKDKDLDEYDQREDGTFARLHIRPHTNISTLTTAEYKRFTEPGASLSLWEDDPGRIEWAATTALEYLPLKRFKALGKAGRRQVETWWRPDSTSRNTNDFMLGQFTWFYTHHLSFDIDTEHSRRIRRGSSYSRNTTWDLGLRLNWNRDRFNQLTIGMIRRRQIDDYPPTPEIGTTSYILLAGGTMSLGQGFFAQASIKSTLLRDIQEDEKTFTRAEIGYEGGHWFRVSVGFERIESKIENDPDNYYRGQGPFIRLVGKI